jgi:lauroyl/myristoyl acyltransferase
MTNSELVQNPIRVQPIPMNPLRRAYATTTFHRALPWPVAVAGVEARAARLWKSPVWQEYAIRSMDYVLGCTSRADEVEKLARRWVFENVKRDELTWRPWQATRWPVERIEVLADVVADGRGAILSFFHHGQHGGMFGSLARRGFRSHVAVLESLLHDLEPGYKGMRKAQHIEMARIGATVFQAKGSMDHMRELLASGELLGLASDLPGSLPVTVFGRNASAGSGAARLAADLGVPLVPVTAHRRGLFVQSFRIGDPIEPRHHEGLESIQQAIFDAQADAILEWPEGLMEPLERWRAVDPEDIERFGVAPNLT